MKRYTILSCCFFAFALLSLSRIAFADCFEDDVVFDPNQGISWNYSWQHCLPEPPAGFVTESNEIIVRAKVWYWGYYPYVQDILCSDTNVFNYSEGYVCSLTPATHPSSNNFYNITCHLNADQLPWLLNDGCINFMMVTSGGTYYLDSSNLEQCYAEAPECFGNFDQDSDVDLSDLMVFSANFGMAGCSENCSGDFYVDGDVDGSDLGLIAANYGKTDCP